MSREFNGASTTDLAYFYEFTGTNRLTVAVFQQQTIDSGLEMSGVLLMQTLRRLSDRDRFILVSPGQHAMDN